MITLHGWANNVVKAAPTIDKAIEKISIIRAEPKV